MKQKTIILMAVAVTCGLAASYMTTRLLAERQPEEVEKIDVLVAKRSLTMGDTMKNPEDLFEMKSFTKGDQPPGALEKFEPLKGKVLSRSLRKGDHITQEDIDTSSMSVAGALPEGYRAVGIRVTMESIAGGFAALPLSRVDVIMTRRGTSDKDTYAQTLLENVLVVAADTKSQRAENGSAMPANVVTVAVKPEDAMKLTLASELGTLKLALRRVNDPSASENDKVTAEGLSTGSRDGGNIVDVDPSTAPRPATPSVIAEAPKVVPTPTQTPPVPAGSAEKAPDPLKQHTLLVRNGSHQSSVTYSIDKAGNVVSGELAPPRPGQPPRIQGQPKANDDDL